MTKELNSRNLKAQWRTPDFTFKEGTGNKLRFEILSTAGYVPQVSKLSMFQRNLKDDKSTEIYNDGVTIIETVDIDMWWRINETMTVMLDNGNIFGNANYFRIH